jgi:hypothetical protein
MRTILLSALLLAPLGARANVELTLHTDRTQLPIKGMQNITHDGDPPAKRTMHVTLGPDWFRRSTGSDSTTFDFAGRRVYTVDGAKHSLTNESLFANVQGRETELDNRLMQSKMLENLKGTAENPMAPTLSEHQIGMRRDAKRPSEIESRVSGGERRFTWHKKELFAWSTELVPLPAPARDQFVRFVRFCVSGHPEILAELAKLDGIPKRLRFTDPGFGQRLAIEVTEVTQTPDAAYVPPADAKETIDDPAIATAVAAVKASTSESRKEAVTRLTAAASAAADGGHPLDAMLGYLEVNIMTGQIPADLVTRKDSVRADANVQALLTAVQAKNQAEAKAAVTTLTRLQMVAPDKAYVLGIFRANMEKHLDDGKSAITDLEAALAKNPLLTGVWKDLGDALFNGYHSENAWQCYDTAALIMPQHSMLGDIAKEATRLTKEYPEYF